MEFNGKELGGAAQWAVAAEVSCTRIRTRIRHVSCDADARAVRSVWNVSSGERTHDGVAGVVDTERALERHREREHQSARHESRDKRSPRLHHVHTAARRELQSTRKTTHHRLIWETWIDSLDNETHWCIASNILKIALRIAIL